MAAAESTSKGNYVLVLDEAVRAGGLSGKNLVVSDLFLTYLQILPQHKHKHTNKKMSELHCVLHLRGVVFTLRFAPRGLVGLENYEESGCF